MKVCLVETSTEGNSQIEKAFYTYLDAAQWLINEGFTPYLKWWFGKYTVGFYLDNPDWYDTEAYIIEMEVEECL